MKLKDFIIGKHFWMSGRKYLCTDKGTRVVIAILWNPGELKAVERSWYVNGKRQSVQTKRIITIKDLSGPPYIGEIVIFEYDHEACSKCKS